MFEVLCAAKRTDDQGAENDIDRKFNNKIDTGKTQQHICDHIGSACPGHQDILVEQYHTQTENTGVQDRTQSGAECGDPEEMCVTLFYIISGFAE